jgi:carbamoyl-phosphate synthase large subunit
VLREVGVDTAGSNVQFAINPADGRMIVIEMNPRVSRSSALASKATGFPIAKIAAKLAVGYTLGRAAQRHHRRTDAGVVRADDRLRRDQGPALRLREVQAGDDRLTTQMKSVGEVMAIGRTFQESLQKALRGLETGVDGFNLKTVDPDTIGDELAYPRAERLWYVADAFGIGMSVEELHGYTKIDPWFLAQIKEIVDLELMLEKRTLDDLADDMRALKRKGFADRRLAYLLKSTEAEVRARGMRWACARCSSASTRAPRSSPRAPPTSTRRTRRSARPAPTDRKKVMVLGGGPNRIGQGIEFDYCCVHAAMALREDGFETIMVNCNPETVSTDYDTSDRLYFEPLTLEDVLEIVHVEKPWGVIVQYGGQTPLKLARDLERNGVPIIGTSPDMIDMAEDRERFQQMLVRLDLKQPPNRTARTEEAALAAASEIGYPLVVRPSYVLGGRAMEIVHDPQDLTRYMHEAVKVSNDSPVLLDASSTTPSRWTSTRCATAAPSSSAASWSTSSRRACTAAIPRARCRRSRCRRRSRRSCGARRCSWRAASTSSA